MNMDWFRHDNNMSTDKTLQFVAKKSGARCCEVTAVWTMLLEHASGHDNRGYVSDIDLEMVSDAQEIPHSLTVTIYETFCNVGSVTSDGFLKRWERYNSVTGKVTMSSAERVRKHREKKRKEAEEAQQNLNLDVTKSNAVTDVTTHNSTAHNITLSKPPLPSLPGDNSKQKESYFEKNDFDAARGCCCSLLGKRQLSQLDQQTLTTWLIQYDFNGFLKQVLYDVTESFMKKNGGKRPNSLAYYSPAIAERAA